MDLNFKGIFGSVLNMVFCYIGLIDFLNLTNLLLGVLGGFFSFLLILLSILEKLEKVTKMVETATGGTFELLTMKEKTTAVKPFRGTEKDIFLISNDQIIRIYDHVEKVKFAEKVKNLLTFRK